MSHPTPIRREERPASADLKKRAGYTVKDWCFQVSISVAYFYELKNKGLIKTAKVFGKVLVLDDPAEWLAQFVNEAA